MTDSTIEIVNTMICNRWRDYAKPTTQRDIIDATGLSQSQVSSIIIYLRAHKLCESTGRIFVAGTNRSVAHYFPCHGLSDDQRAQRLQFVTLRLRGDLRPRVLSTGEPPLNLSSPAADPRPPYVEGRYTPSRGDYLAWGTHRYGIQQIVSRTDQFTLVLTTSGTFRITDFAAVPHPDHPHLRVFTPDRKLTT